MEYIDLIKKYWQMNEENPLNMSITCMYLFLLEHWDRNNKQDFELSDAEMASRLKIARTTIKSSKQVLRNLGLISYQIANGLPTLYKIITDYNVNRKTPLGKEEKNAEKKVVKTSLKNSKPIEVPPQKEEIEVSDVLTEPQKEVEVQSETLTINNVKIPTFEEVLAFAKTLEKYEDGFESKLRNKYLMWKDNNWRTYRGAPISNWRQTVENSLQFLKEPRDLFDIPKVNRPKVTYNE